MADVPAFHVDVYYTFIQGCSFCKLLIISRISPKSRENRNHFKRY